jgi:hypothetical protein
MKGKRHIQSFNEHQENLNISDVSDSLYLLRGVKKDTYEYIDDPKSRRISTGNCSDEDYVNFLKNFKKLGIQDPTKSIHAYLNPEKEQLGMIKYYGNTYRVFPKESDIFSFCNVFRNGGLGSTWFFPERFDSNLNRGFDDMYYKNKDKFFEIISNYQEKLINMGVIGNLTYEELIELSKKKYPLQLWTENPLLHRRII